MRLLRQTTSAVSSNSTEVSVENGTDFSHREISESRIAEFLMSGRNGYTLTAPPTISGAGFELLDLPSSFPHVVSGVITFRIRFQPLADSPHEQLIDGMVTFFTNSPTEPELSFAIQGRAFDETRYPEITRIEVGERDFQPIRDNQGNIISEPRREIKVFGRTDPRGGNVMQYASNLSNWRSDRDSEIFPTQRGYLWNPSSAPPFEEGMLFHFIFPQEDNIDRLYFRILPRSVEE